MNNNVMKDYNILIVIVNHNYLTYKLIKYIMHNIYKKLNNYTKLHRY